jgi:hypothetical protein
MYPAETKEMQYQIKKMYVLVCAEYYVTYLYTPRGKVRKLCCIASLKGLRLVHFFRGPLKEMANAISGSLEAPAKI